MGDSQLWPILCDPYLNSHLLITPRINFSANGLILLMWL